MEEIRAEVQDLRRDLTLYQWRLLDSIIKESRMLQEPLPEDGIWIKDDLAAEMQSLKARLERLEALAAGKETDHG